jgi:uncharacterized protein (TIGR03083 family)
VTYRDTRERLSAFVLGLDESQRRAPLPACPGWTVQDAVSHVVGIVADLQDGNLDGVGSDAWTLAQVTVRRGLPIAEVVGEWAARAPEFEVQMAALGDAVGSQLVADVTMHELDVRAAVGDAGARATDGVAVAFGYYGHKVADRVVEAGLPALSLESESGTTTWGTGEPAVTLRTTRFEALRAMGGRRSLDQVRAYDWSGDPTPYVALFSSYGCREDPLVE